MDNRDFIDTLERFNLDLGIWTVLKVKLPIRMANHFSFSLNPENIVIMGGMKRKNEDYLPKESKKSFELENRIWVLKTTNFKWKELKPFPFKKKLSNVVYNDYGKFFCFIIESNATNLINFIVQSFRLTTNKLQCFNPRFIILHFVAFQFISRWVTGEIRYLFQIRESDSWDCDGIFQPVLPRGKTFVGNAS